MMPEINAPIAYPRSRQKRYTPIVVARHSGCATSLMAAKRVGTHLGEFLDQIPDPLDDSRERPHS
jgi:hypothetical protein